MLLRRSDAEPFRPDNSGRTPLHAAAANGHEHVVKVLVTNGADIEGKDRHGRTALRLAVDNGHDAVVREPHQCASRYQLP